MWRIQINLFVKSIFSGILGKDDGRIYIYMTEWIRVSDKFINLKSCLIFRGRRGSTSFP